MTEVAWGHQSWAPDVELTLKLHREDEDLLQDGPVEGKGGPLK